MRTLGTLVSSGVPILEAIAYHEGNFRQRRVRRPLPNRSTNQIREGESIAKPLKGKFKARPKYRHIVTLLLVVRFRRRT